MRYPTILTFPENSNPIDTPVLRMTMSDDGILHVAYKKTEKQTLEDIKLAIEELKKIAGNRKACMIADVTYIGETSSDIRNFIAKELPGTVRAIAIISGSVLGKMRTNLFFSLKPQPFPVEVFDEEKAAKQWLGKHLQ